jgi:hypothetical protein
MAVCAEYRMPHSEFLSWSQLDRDKAIWWHVRVKSTCQNCGTRDAEWEEEHGGHPWAYLPAVGHCRGCEVKAQAQRDIDDEPNAYRVGSYATLVKDPTDASAG